MIDLETSRRDYFEKCKYWTGIPEKDIDDLAELVYNRRESGIFYAKPQNVLLEESQIVGEAFMFKRQSITIVTEDNVNLGYNDLVEFDGSIYRVESVSLEPINKQRQYRKRISYKRYINLRG